VFSVGVEHLPLLRKGKLMLPLLQKQKERPKLPLLLNGGPPLEELEKPLLEELEKPLLEELEKPPLEELEKPPPLDGGLPPLDVKLNGDAENKRLPAKEPSLLERNEFVENPNSVRLDVGLNELLGELENPNSVGLDVGLNELSSVGVVERQGVSVVERLGVSVVGAVSLLRHL
jgi:hypothetical protein